MGEGWWFFDCSSPFYFVLIAFQCNFCSDYNTIFWLDGDRPSGLLSSCPLYFFPCSFLLTFSSFFAFYHSFCAHAQVFWKTLVVLFFPRRNSPSFDQRFTYQYLIRLKKNFIKIWDWNDPLVTLFLLSIEHSCLWNCCWLVCNILASVTFLLYKTWKLSKFVYNRDGLDVRYSCLRASRRKPRHSLHRVVVTQAVPAVSS